MKELVWSFPLKMHLLDTNNFWNQYLIIACRYVSHSLSKLMCSICAESTVCVFGARAAALRENKSLQQLVTICTHVSYCTEVKQAHSLYLWETVDTNVVSEQYPVWNMTICCTASQWRSISPWNSRPTAPSAWTC